MSRIALLAALAALLSPTAHANIDMALNTTNFVAGQASTLSVDGSITQSGDSTAIVAATIKLRFDPLKATPSNFTAPTGSGWTVLGYNLDHVSEGWAMSAGTGFRPDTPGAAIVAGAYGAANPAYVFVAASDKRIYAYNADTGQPPVPSPDNVLRDGAGNSMETNTVISNNMAAFGGRLYALGSGVADGDNYDFTLYCFGQP